MEQTQITAAIRRALREPTARRVSDADITAVTLRAVTLLGLKIKEKDPSYFKERKSISSNTNVFTIPTGCKKINNVWDYGGTVISVTGEVDNGSGLVRITAATHGFADADIVTIHDVLGCTEANGTWQIDYVDADTFDLLGSTFANAYTSGGKVFEEKTDMPEIEKKNLSEQSGASENAYYLRSQSIVVDDVSFTDDIVVDYETAPSAISDIPADYHEYLVSWPVVNLLHIPKPDDPTYSDMMAIRQFHHDIVKMVESDIQRTFKQSSGPTFIRNVWSG